MPVAIQPFTGTFVADPVHSSVAFAVKHMKVSVFRAWFEDIDARLVADEDGIRIEGSARVESVSIRKPEEFRQHVVYSEEFFDARTHPEITVRAEDLRLEEDGTATVHGELTIKGITRPVTATGTFQPPVDDPFGSRRAALEFTATVDRREWDLHWQTPLPGGGDALGNDVALTAHLELIEQS